MSARPEIARARRWIIKIGSALLTDTERGLNHEAMAGWVEQMAELQKAGAQIVLVSSGSVVEGMARLGWRSRPHELFRQQAAAAVGQMGLAQAWESAFQRHGLHTGQVLLTHDDLGNRRRYLNARTTLTALLELGVVPVVNENDSVVTDEIRFGDNDTLAGLVANLVEADVLLILTDVGGLYTASPAEQAGARLVPEGRAGDPALDALAGGSGVVGRGGMVSKLNAARTAARSGAVTVIASGRQAQVIRAVAAGEAIGTVLRPASGPLAARKQWLAGHLQVRGRLHLDAGAVRMLCEGGGSLLAVGVRRVEGDFVRGEVVACVGPDGRDVARGLVNYDASEASRIAGRGSEEIEAVLGYVDEPELVHRDNLVALD